MAHRVMRNKRHQRWTQRLNEIFQEWDKSQTGQISLESMTEIYRIYKVDLKVDDVRARLDKNGNIRKNDFIEFSIETKLLDLADRKISEGGQSKIVKTSQRKERSQSESQSGGLLCCFPQRRTKKKDDVPDKVEAAFNKFDTDGNGFIDWSEFKQLASQLDPEQARRIFEACDSSGDRQISLEEFRTMANMKVK